MTSGRDGSHEPHPPIAQQSLEAATGRVLGIEVKAASTPRSDDFRWLAQMRDRLDRAGSHFMGGLVLHTGQRRLPFGDRLMALPASDLWS